MPLIKPRTRGRQLVKHRNGLDRENNELRYEFLGESPSTCSISGSIPNSRMTRTRSCRGRGRTAGASAELAERSQHASHPSGEALTATVAR